MNNRKELIQQKMVEAGPLLPDDIKELRSLCNNSVFLKFLNSLLQESDDQLAFLANTDLTTDAGVREAIYIQSKARVLSTAVDSFLDLVTTDDETLTKINNQEGDQP